MGSRVFTVGEANQVLPLVREIVGVIRDRMSWLFANQPEVHVHVQESRIPVEAPVDPEYFASLVHLRRALGRLDVLGCQLKDPQMGLVDFPAKLSGKDVLLCWRLGEDSVAHYHDPAAGYAGRQPIPPEDLDTPREEKDGEEGGEGGSGDRSR